MRRPQLLAAVTAALLGVVGLPAVTVSAAPVASAVSAATAAPDDPVSYTHLDVYKRQVSVFESPAELEGWLSDRAGQGYGARLTAGYCWRWSDPRADGTLVPDVAIGDWARPWNLRGDRSIGGAPPSPLWATDPAGLGQVGCIYTAQGFEYDFAGVKMCIRDS